MPLSFAPGEAYQFDWSHEIVVMGGATKTVKVGHVRLCNRRIMFVRAYPRETQGMVFDVHESAFAFFRGACTPGTYDNMKTAMGAIFVSEGRQYNRRFLQMCSHHLVDPVAGTPALGWAKSQVENHIGLIPERFFTPRLRVKTNNELNASLTDKCGAYAKVHPNPGRPEQTVWEVFEEERPNLVPYRGRFDGLHTLPASVSKNCLVRIDINKYPVNVSAAGRPVDMHAYPDRIVVRQIGRVVAEYARCHRRGETIYDPSHYVPILARKPGALRNRTRFKDWVLPTALSGFGADPPDLMTVTYRWSPRSPRCSRMACLRSRPSRAGDVGRRPPVRCDYQHPHAPARSRTGGDHLHAICAAAAKGKNRSVERIGVQALLHRYRQSNHAFAHITHILGRVTRTPNNSTIIGSQTSPKSGVVLGLQYGRPPVATHRKKAGSRSSPQGRQEAEET